MSDELNELMDDEPLFDVGVAGWDSAAGSRASGDEPVFELFRWDSVGNRYASDDGVVTIQWSSPLNGHVVKGLGAVVDRAIDEHNTSETAHEDIRALIAASNIALADRISGDFGNKLRLGADEKLLVADTLIDPRDRQKYRTVLMPDGKVWMAENLNYVTPTSWEFNNDPAMGKRYGRLYTWNEALTVAPPGWHLPTRAEWQALVDAVEALPGNGANTAGTKLKSASGWTQRPDGSSGNGTDDFGFSGLPGGVYDGSAFTTLRNGGLFWTATERNSTLAYTRDLYYHVNGAVENYYYKYYGHSVRCVKDTPSVVYSTEEVATGDVWINGKPVYRRAFTGNVVAAADVPATVALVRNTTTKFEALVRSGGWWQSGDSDPCAVNGSFTSNNPGTLGKIGQSMIYIGDTNREIRFNSSAFLARSGTTNNAFQIWVEYTKVS